MRETADKVFVNTSFPGVNVGAILTRKGLICIDAPSYPRDAREWTTRLQHVDPRPVRYVILTNAHGDRLLNIRWLNGRIIAHERTAERLIGYDKRFPQSMIDSLSLRQPDAGRELSSAPVEKAAISFDTKMDLLPGGREIRLVHLPGPDAGSIGVYIPDVQLLFTGDVVVTGTHPLLKSADIDDWLYSLKRLQEPPYSEARLIPGRGDEVHREEVAQLASYLEDVRVRVLEMLESQRPRSELSALVVEFLPRFPVDSLPREWVQAQLRAGFEHVYEVLQEKSRVQSTSMAVQ